jgi:hypothetical protein
MQDLEPQNFIPVIESDDFIGDSSSVATITDGDQAELDMDVLLGSAVDVDSIVSRVAEPSRTCVDYVKLASEDPDSFDGADDVCTDVLYVPEPSTYIAPPQRVAKAELAADRELRKVARRSGTLTSWIKSELSRGRKIEDLVSYARAVDPKIAGDIEGCYLVMCEPVPIDEE